MPQLAPHFDLTRCVYCDGHLPKERRGRGPASRSLDHAVGRQLFLKPNPPDLGAKVGVPSCRRCNGIRPKPHEDYFRSMLSLSDAGESAIGQRFHREVGLRAYEKDGGLRSKVYGSLSEVEVATESGLFVRRGLAQSIDHRSLRIVAEKWVRGLHWKATGERLPRATTFDVGYLPGSRLDEVDFHFPNVVAAEASWPGTFEAWRSSHSEMPTLHRWTFRVWEHFGMVVVVNHPFPAVVEASIVMDGRPDFVVTRERPARLRRSGLVRPVRLRSPLAIPDGSGRPT